MSDVYRKKFFNFLNNYQESFIDINGVICKVSDISSISIKILKNSYGDVKKQALLRMSTNPTCFVFETSESEEDMIWKQLYDDIQDPKEILENEKSA